MIQSFLIPQYISNPLISNYSPTSIYFIQTDTVNSINFTPDASHLVTVSNDGTIGIVRCGNWQVEKHWLKPHKGMAVDTLAIHPTGKIAMTTGHDGVLRTWNLVKGRQAYATNLVPRWKIDAKNISVLKWSPSGNTYLLAASNKIDVYSIETAGVKEEFQFDSKIVCVEYLSEEHIAVGLTNGKISIYDIGSGTQCSEIQAHDARVKCLARFEQLLVSASSSGEIKLWSCKKDKLTLLNKVNCSARISCLTVTASCQSANLRRDEVDLTDKVVTKPSNKLRLKQKVTIEEEYEEEKTTRMSKKKRDKKKARKLLEEADAENESALKIKKSHAKVVEESSPKKNTNNVVDLQFEPLKKKKKKLLDLSKKRKKVPEMADDSVVEVPVKKKKDKVDSGTKAADAKNTVNKKKRKIPVEEVADNSPKRKKVIGTVVSALSKKNRKKKYFKNKVPR